MYSITQQHYPSWKEMKCFLTLSQSPLFIQFLFLHSIFLEHFKIICAYSLLKKINNEPQDITQISFIEILDEPPCCVRRCTYNLSLILGVIALNLNSHLAYTHCSSSGSLFFTHLGGIKFIVHI